MSESESESRGASVSSYASEYEDDQCVRATIETARFRSILQSFNEIATHTFFLFTEENLIMFPHNFTIGETVEKRGKRKKDRDDKSYNDPKVVCIFNPENILYSYNLPEEKNFISFPTKDIISSIKQYGKKELLMMEICAEDTNMIQYTSGTTSNTMSGVTSMRGKNVDDGIYQPIDISDYSDAKIKHTGNEADFKRILGGIGSSTTRAPIDCFLRTYSSGFTIESKTEGCSQTFNIGNNKIVGKPLYELKWNRNTINALKKLQIDGGVYSINYREDDPLTIERKIANIADIYFSFDLSS